MAFPTTDYTSMNLKDQPRSVRPLVYLSCTAASLGAIVFGYDIGGSGGTFIMDSFRQAMGWGLNTGVPSDSEVHQTALITSIFAVGAMVGALPSGAMSDNFGRRRALQLAAVVFTIGAVLQFTCYGIVQLIVGRFVGGMGVGMMSMLMGNFMAELAPERVRGMVVTLMQIGITFGIVLAALLNVPLSTVPWGWRFSYGGNGFLSFIMAGLLCFLPESPRFLMMKGRTEEARASLNKLRYSDEVEAELEAMRAELEAEDAVGSGTWSELVSTVENMDYRMAAGFFIQFWQQFTGINAIMYFAPVIFSLFLDPATALIANIAIMAVNFVSTFIAFALVDTLGRRTLLMVGGFFQALACLVVAVLSSGDYKTNKFTQIVIVVVIALYVMSFAFGWGPIPWVVCSEIFPQRLRGKAMSITTAVNWITNFIIAQCTPLMLQPTAFDLWGTFVFFGAFCVAMNLWVFVFLPETKGIPLENMESVFKERRALLKDGSVGCFYSPAKAAEMAATDLELSV